MSDARRYAVWPEPRSRSLKGSRPSVPHGTNFVICILCLMTIVQYVINTKLVIKYECASIFTAITHNKHLCYSSILPYFNLGQFLSLFGSFVSDKQHIFFSDFTICTEQNSCDGMAF